MDDFPNFDDFSSMDDGFVPKILFIKGVFLHDCTPMDDLFEEQLLAQIEDDIVPVKHDTIPAVFTDMESWIKKTNVPCWYCDLTFNTVPLFIPGIIEPSGQQRSVSVEGVFDSWRCCVKYIHLHYPKIMEQTSKEKMLGLLHKIMTGKPMGKVPPAESKYKMERYGNGNMTIQEYKEKNKNYTLSLDHLGATHSSEPVVAI